MSLTLPRPAPSILLNRGEFLDDRVGIVKRLEEIPIEPGSPRFFHYAAEACNVAAFARQANFANTGGASSDRDTAKCKALGEAIERYCAAIFDVDELLLSSADELTVAYAEPASFALFSRDQYDSPGFPWQPFTDATTVRWCTAMKAAAPEQAVLVPAAMVFVPYHYYRGSGDTPITQPISTGLACHATFEAAALGGLCEVIERDAFTLTWQAMLSPAQIRVETLLDYEYDLVRRLEYAEGVRVRLFRLPSDHRVPCILAVLESTAEDAPALVFAAAAHPSARWAARSALEELAHTRRYSQQIHSYTGRLELGPPDYREVVDQLDHLNIYCDHGNRDLVRFLFASDRRIAFDEIDTYDGDDALTTTVSELQRIGTEPLLVDLTTSDVDELGLAVVRAIVPSFHPLFMGHRIRSLGGRRLWEVPQRLGYAGVTDGADNPAPHPYP
jgi:ribosomal protein S12 methylthiotransferase accessory factor